METLKSKPTDWRMWGRKPKYLQHLLHSSKQDLFTQSCIPLVMWRCATPVLYNNVGLVLVFHTARDTHRMNQSSASHQVYKRNGRYKSINALQDISAFNKIQFQCGPWFWMMVPFLCRLYCRRFGDSVSQMKQPANGFNNLADISKRSAL